MWMCFFVVVVKSRFRSIWKKWWWNRWFFLYSYISFVSIFIWFSQLETFGFDRIAHVHCSSKTMENVLFIDKLIAECPRFRCMWCVYLIGNMKRQNQYFRIVVFFGFFSFQNRHCLLGWLFAFLFRCVCLVILRYIYVYFITETYHKFKINKQRHLIWFFSLFTFTSMLILNLYVC